MRLLHVIPIARGSAPETLTYFSGRDDAEEGMLVEIPLRKRTVPALVIGSEDVKDAKSLVKSSGFALRKISQKKPIGALAPEFVQAAKVSADYHATTTGAILRSLLPHTALTHTKVQQPPAKQKAHPSDVLVLQAEFEERINTYRNTIRESFARKQSLFLAVPTIADADALYDAVVRGIEQYTFRLHSGLSSKEADKQWNGASKATHPILIIGTIPFLTLPRYDIGTIIIERESSRSYRSVARPFIDMRIFAECYARLRGIRLIYADFPLRVETTHRYRTGELEELRPLKLRPISEAAYGVIDMKAETALDKTKIEEKKFQALGSELRKLIAHTLHSREQLFIFSSRRGLAPLVVCKDCGTVVENPNTGTPATLHRVPGGYAYVDHKTSEVYPVGEKCLTCGSWNLISLGVAIQRVEEEVLECAPAASVLKLDRDSTPTHAAARKLIQKFYDTPGSILIGTEMALPYLSKPLAYAAVASLDSLLAIPEWRISERIFAILLRLRELSTKGFLVQTRKQDSAIIHSAVEGNMAGFYKEEITLRQALRYPPFSTIIKISVSGAPARIKEEMDSVVELLGEKYPLAIATPPFRIEKNIYAIHGSLRLEKKDWPDPDLLARLRSLPPHFTVSVDPDSVLS